MESSWKNKFEFSTITIIGGMKIHKQFQIWYGNVPRLPYYILA